MHRGFVALQDAGVISTLPRMIGVQAQACAPVWAVYTSGGPGLSMVQEGETRAEGIRVRFPVRGDAALAAVESTGGTIVAVAEDELLRGLGSPGTRRTERRADLGRRLDRRQRCCSRTCRTRRLPC